MFVNKNKENFSFKQYVENFVGNVENKLKFCGQNFFAFHKILWNVEKSFNLLKE